MDDLIEMPAGREAFGIGNLQAEPGIRDMGKVVAQSGPQIVDDDKRFQIIALQQAIDKMGANEATAPGNQHTARHAHSPPETRPVNAPQRLFSKYDGNWILSRQVF